MWIDSVQSYKYLFLISTNKLLFLILVKYPSLEKWLLSCLCGWKGLDRPAIVREKLTQPC